MILIRTATFLGVLLFFNGILLGQTSRFNFSNIDLESGLSNNHVNAVYRDETGFVWFGTNSGLNRYDGYKCRIFSSNYNDVASLSDNYITEIFELPNHQMWISLGQYAANIFNPITEHFDRDFRGYLKSLSLPPQNVSFIHKDKRGDYWFLYANRKLFKYITSKKKSTNFSYHPPQAAGTGITGITEDSKGNLWLIYSNGFLLYVDGKTLHPLNNTSIFTPFVKDRNLDLRVFVDSKNFIWCYDNTEPIGVYQIDWQHNSLNHFNTGSSEHKLLDNLIEGIVEDQSGNIWIGADHGGVNIVSASGPEKMIYLVHKENDKRSLSYNSIEALYADRLGVIWVATGKKGVNFINQNIPQFELYQHDPNNKNSLPYNDINCFQEDKKGNIWLGTNGGGIIYFNRQTKKFTQYINVAGNTNSLTNNVIVSLYLDDEDKLWIGTYLGGLDVFDGKEFKHIKHNSKNLNSLADDRIWSIMEDKDHSMWVGTLLGGLDHFYPQKNIFEHYTSTGIKKNHLKANYVPILNMDRFNNLWIGTSEGIDILNSSRNDKIKYKRPDGTSSLRIGSIFDIITDKRGMVWVASKNGLALFMEKTHTFKIFSTLNGLPDNNIIDITEDKKGNLLVATSKGLSYLVINTQKDSVSFNVINFNEFNNLQSKVFSERSGTLLRDGKIIIGGSTGFNIIDLDGIIKNKIEPPLVFTSIDVFNNEINVNQAVNQNIILRKAVPFTSEIKLNYNENMFSIEFAALNLLRNNQYAFKLDGYDKNWIYTGTDNHKVTYSNIDPGNYVFRIKATNNTGGWSNNEKQINIIVKPQLWKTPGAYLLYLLTIIGLIYLFRKYTLDKAKMRFEVELQKKETERILVLDSVKTKFFTNVSHEFRTPLSLILTPLNRIISNTPDPGQKKQLQMVQRNAKRLLNLVNQLLDFRKMEVQEFKLQPTEGDLVSFAKEIFCSFSDISEMKKIQFVFSSNVENLIMYFDKDKMEKIFFNLLSNAFKYTHTNGRIELIIWNNEVADTDDSNLEIIVKDSGIGIPIDKQEQIFEPFFQNDTPANLANPGTGIGLAITKEFVKLHNGNISVESKDEGGTSFKVSLPIKAHTVINCNEILNEVSSESAFENTDTAEDNQNSKSLPVILLVEDNDDFRFYLKDNLNKDYFVVETTNGHEAWEKLETLTPDLIVTDVMMPFMDGIELTKRVKANNRLSLVPVVLLTAGGDDDMQLESYNLGASDFITKPFTFEILESRLKNILKQSKFGQKRTKIMEVTPSEMNITSADELFIKQVLAVIEKNISDPDFSVEQLSNELFLHRAVMYRKLLAITGISPLEFIRRVRLKTGWQLLEKRQMTIAEVAYEVGFNNPKKFSQYFKEQYDLTPTQFQKQLPGQNKSHIDVFS